MKSLCNAIHSVHACTCFRSPGSGHPSLQGWTICTEMPPACHLEHNMQFVRDIKLFSRVDRFVLRHLSPLHMMNNSAQCIHSLWSTSFLGLIASYWDVAHPCTWCANMQYGVHIFFTLNYRDVSSLAPDMHTLCNNALQCTVRGPHLFQYNAMHCPWSTSLSCCLARGGSWDGWTHPSAPVH